jgi:ribosomal protein S18 acetylase RimI-like enzyme
MGEALQMRRAAPTDWPAIRALTHEAYAKWVPIIGREPVPMTTDYAEAVKKHRIDLVHLDGMLVALLETVPKADHLLIASVAVLPALQGRGLGRKLMAHAEEIAAALGLGEIRLFANKLFVENIRLYLRLGYRVDREEEFKGGLLVHMSKRIAASGTPSH